MFQIETAGVLNGYLVFPEDAMIDMKNIGLKISGFVYFFSKVKMNHFPESQ
jgi:hypothetical protein